MPGPDGIKTTIYDIRMDDTTLDDELGDLGQSEEAPLTESQEPPESGFAISQEALDGDMVDLGDLAPKAWRNPETAQVDCQFSNVYLTYMNYLQAQEMEKQFGGYGEITI